jgi:hypothetical protein
MFGKGVAGTAALATPAVVATEPAQKTKVIEKIVEKRVESPLDKVAAEYKQFVRFLTRLQDERACKNCTIYVSRRLHKYMCDLCGRSLARGEVMYLLGREVYLQHYLQVPFKKESCYLCKGRKLP